jgi:MFS family permease
MLSYWKRIQNFAPDIKLFLLYNLLANVGFGVTELVFNFYLLELGFREDFIGEWRSVQTIAMACAAATVGFFINRFRVWNAIFAGFLLFVLTSFGLGLAENRLLLLILGAVYGIGLAFLFNPLMPFIMEFAKAEHRQYASAVSFSLVSLSLTVGSLVGGFTPSVFQQLVERIEPGSLAAYRAAILTGAAISALGAIPMLKMKEPRRPRETALQVSHKMAESVTQRRRVRKDVGIFILAGGLMSIGVGMVQPFYNVFLKSLGASDSQVGYIFALGGLSAAIIGLGAPMLANRLGSLSAVLVLRLSIIPFYLPLIFFPNLGVAMVAFLARQVSISMAWPIDSTFISEVLPPRARSGVFGLRSSAWNAGFALSSLAAGRIIVDRGYDWTFVSLLVFTAASAILFYTYFVRHPLIREGSIPSALSRGQRAHVAVPARDRIDMAESKDDPTSESV